MNGSRVLNLPRRFQQAEAIGGGAMGSVYRVIDSAGDAWALKELDTRAMPAADAAEAVALFEREARMLALLADPCFPLLVDFFEEDGRSWLQMEFLKGRTLEQIVQSNGPCPFPYLLPIACDLARGLAVLHEHPMGPIIFRDLKPGNVMVTDEGEVSMVDFGIARCHRPGATRDTQPLGTPGFAAPEQYGAAQTDARADLYALGATLYFALTGQDPGVAFADPPSVRMLAPTCPPALDDIIRKCLQLDRERRPTRAREVLRALEDVPNPAWQEGLAPQRRALALPGERSFLSLDVRGRTSPWAALLLAIFVVLAGLSEWVVRAGQHLANEERARIQAEAVAACVGNVQALVGSLDVYQALHRGKYPPDLRRLMASHVQNPRVPLCRATGSDTYSAGYQVSKKLDTYTLTCTCGHAPPVGSLIRDE